MVWRILSLCAASLLLAACELSLEGKDHCGSDSDCLGGRVCELNVCVDERELDAASADADPSEDAAGDQVLDDASQVDVGGGDAGPDPDASQLDATVEPDAARHEAAVGDGSEIQQDPDGATSADADASQSGGDTGAASETDAGPCAFPANGTTITDPQRIACLCGVGSDGDNHTVLDTGSQTSPFVVTTAARVVLNEDTTDFTNGGWTLWNTATRMRIAYGEGKLLDQKAGRFLVLRGAALELRAHDDGSVVYTFDATVAANAQSGGFATDGSYVWTQGARVQAYDLRGARWLDVPVFAESVAYLAFQRLIALPEAIYLERTLQLGANDFQSEVTRHARSGEVTSFRPAARLASTWFEDGSHLVSVSGGTHIYNLDGSRARLLNGTDPIAGVGDFYWSTSGAARRLSRVSTGEQLAEYTEVRGGIGVDLFLFVDGPNPIYKIERDTTGTWTGSAAGQADPALRVLLTASRRLGCGGVWSVSALDNGHVAIAVRDGYFIYEIAAAKMLSFSALMYSAEPHARFRSINFARSGNTVGIFRGAELEPLFQSRTFYSPVAAPVFVSSQSLEPNSFELSYNGDSYALSGVEGIFRLDGSRLYDLPILFPASNIGLPSLISPAGDNVAQRGDCNRECTAGIYHAGSLAGTVDARVLGWLDNETIYARQFADSQVRGYKLDGSRAFGDIGCSLRATYPVKWLGIGYPPTQTLSNREVYMPSEGARCDLTTGALTPVARYLDTLPSELTGDHGIYIVDEARSVAIAPY